MNVFDIVGPVMIGPSAHIPRARRVLGSSHGRFWVLRP